MSLPLHPLRTIALPAFLITLFLLPLNAQKSTPAQDIVYEIFVHSFRDSNGDGIGDLKGVISQLDYIRDLGATYIWLMPVHPSPSYHKYDVVDYYAIDPQYGTMKDMETLIKEAHKRNLKVMMDLVVNHTSASHKWFKEAMASTESPYHNYYVWKDFESVQNDINKKAASPDSENLTQWHPGNDQNYHYYGFFWQGMPDLNFDNPAVREEVFKIGKFWLKKGVDGFRLDAAKHIFTDDRIEDTKKFWEEFTSHMRSVKKEVKIVGEVWADPATISSLSSGLPSMFNFGLAGNIADLLNAGNINGFIKFYRDMETQYSKAVSPVEDAILLSNHDMNRIGSTLERNEDKSKLALSILMTLPGTPYIYYGEEIGMLGVKPDENLREPFLWGDGNFEEKTWRTPLYSTKENVRSLNDQKADPQSIYSHYKEWIQFRKDHPAFAAGKIEFLKNKLAGLLIYLISDNDETYYVIHNLAPTPTSYPLQSNTPVVIQSLAYRITPSETDGKKNEIILPAYGSVILKSISKENK